MQLRAGKMPDQRLVLLSDHDGPPSSGEHTGSRHTADLDDGGELGAREARARILLDKEWREAFGVPLGESLTDETAQVQSSDLIVSSDAPQEADDRTPITKPSPFHAILPPGMPDEQEH